MKIGIVGFPQTGKKTLFKLLTGAPLSASHSESKKSAAGIAEIRDGRFDVLVKMYKPKKEARAKVNVILFPDLEKDSFTKSEVLKDFDGVDAICHVVRAFADESVYHVHGSVDAPRDIDMINGELILQDLLFIEKRLERMEKDKNKPQKEKPVVNEKELLLKFKSELDKEQPLRLLELTKDERKFIASYPFYTLKENIIVLNVSDSELKNEKLLHDMQGKYKNQHLHFMQICAKAEAEIAELGTEEERAEFLAELGIREPALNLLTKTYLQTLGLISFFTVGEDEVRQWCIRGGSSAPEAAGDIHTDLQKGFIRAEVMKQDELISLGGEEKVKQAGKLYLKGKDYIVEDGDIINVRFNV